MEGHAQAVMDAAVQAGAALICENAENQTELCEEAEVEAPLDGLLPHHHSRGRHRRRGKSRRSVGGEEEDHDDEDEEDDESESEESSKVPSVSTATAAPMSKAAAAMAAMAFHELLVRGQSITKSPPVSPTKYTQAAVKKRGVFPAV